MYCSRVLTYRADGGGQCKHALFTCGVCPEKKMAMVWGLELVRSGVLVDQPRGYVGFDSGTGICGIDFDSGGEVK